MKNSFRGIGLLLVPVLLGAACSSDGGSAGPGGGSAGQSSTAGSAGASGAAMSGAGASAGGTSSGSGGTGGAVGSSGSATTSGASSGGSSGSDVGGSAGTGGAGGAPSAIVLPAYTSSAAKTSGNMGTRNAGHQFEVTDAPIVVRDLGIWDNGADGLAAAHTVTLFALDKAGADASATPVVGGSVSVPAGKAAELEAGFRFAALAAPITLPPGFYAVIGYGLSASDLPGDGGGVPLPATGIRDAQFDPYEFVTTASPAYPGGGDPNGHANVSLRFEAKVAPLRIMPLGASITDGFQGTKAGYRGPLKGLLDAAGVTFQFVGSWTDNPGTPPLVREQQHHEGHSGFVIRKSPDRDGIYDHLPQWLGPLGSQADVFLIVIGTNDVDTGYELDKAGERLEALVTSIQALQPKAHIVLAQLPPIDDVAEDELCVQYNQKVAAVVESHRAKGEAVSTVDLHAAVPLSELADKLHPNDAGYAKVAKAFFDEIQALDL